ncbi:protein of unknown function [Brochothrix thermosphacta]|nr:protein of unknown function [Brochothrix thermosphacta]
MLQAPGPLEKLIVHFQNNIKRDLTKTIALTISCIVAINTYIPSMIIIYSLSIIGFFALTFSINQVLTGKPKHHKHAYLFDTLENILFTLNSDENEKNN